MNLRDSLNRYYYDTIVCDMKQVNKSGGGEISYNTIMYLDVISFQQEDEGCTVSRLSDTLNISNSAATMKVNELVKMGLVKKTRSEKDKRVIYLSITDTVADALKKYDSPFERAIQSVEKNFSDNDIKTFCSVLDTFINEYKKDF